MNENQQTKVKPKASKLKAKDPQDAEPSKPKILIFGAPGVGKTWASIDFPSCYYIDTEGGADLAHYTAKLKKAGGKYMGPDEGALDFPTVIEQFQALASEEHGYRTVIVDSISKLFNSAVAMEAERLGDKDAFGASKKPAIAYMRRLVSWVNRLDMNVIFIAHSKAEWGVDSKGERVEIGQTFDCWDKLEYELHLALQIIKKGDLRQAKVRKSRIEAFQDAIVFDWSYDSFAKRYGREIIEGTVKTISLATEDQVKEIERLLTVVKIEEATVSKWLSAASAEGWNELNTDQAAKVIIALKAKLV